LKKLLVIIVLGLLWSGNAYANKVQVIDTSRDWIRILIKYNIWFIETPEQRSYKMSIATKIGEKHCDNFNKSLYRFLSLKDGYSSHDFTNKLGKSTHSFYCANSLKEALRLYESSRLPKHENWTGPILFQTGPYYQSKSIRNAIIQIEENTRLKKQRKLQLEIERKRAEQKRLAEANKNNTKSNSNSSGRERAKQVMSHKGGEAIQGFLGGLIGLALGFGLYSVMDRKIKKKLNDKYFLGAAFFIGWILSKFI